MEFDEAGVKRQLCLGVRSLDLDIQVVQVVGSSPSRPLWHANTDQHLPSLTELSTFRYEA